MIKIFRVFEKKKTNFKTIEPRQRIVTKYNTGKYNTVI